MSPPYLDALLCRELAPWAPALRAILAERWLQITEHDRKGRAYAERIAALPFVRPASIDLNRDWIRIGCAEDLAPNTRAQIDDDLRRLIPWRKGPFEVFGIREDSEWAAHMKGNRLWPHLAGLAERRILDIGSSSGYYMFRMLAAAPALVVGIEPYLAFYYQYLLLQRFIDAPRLLTLPLRLEALPILEAFFDTVFCMGILYHQRDPQAALAWIARMMRTGGELVLETLVIEGDQDGVLKPMGRYAKMNNVYAVPSVKRIEGWLHHAGFGRIRCVDVTATTSREQRRTAWMPFESLADFLDREDPQRTVEDHPAPVRAIVLAERH